MNWRRALPAGLAPAALTTVLLYPLSELWLPQLLTPLQRSKPREGWPLLQLPAPTGKIQEKAHDWFDMGPVSTPGSIVVSEGMRDSDWPSSGHVTPVA